MDVNYSDNKDVVRIDLYANGRKINLKTNRGIIVTANGKIH